MTPSGVRVLLTRSEMFHAVLVGAERQLDNIFAGRQDAYGQTAEDGWRSHNEGAAGEAATAKYFGVYWNGALGNLRAPDVGGAQVRTRSRHSFQLIVHPPPPKGRDRPNAIYILVTGRAPELYLRGWCYGYEAQVAQYWSDPADGRPAYFVPVSDLHDMAQLEVRDGLIVERKDASVTDASLVTLAS